MSRSQQTARSSLRSELDRLRLQRTPRQLELVIAALRERPADRARRMDLAAPASETTFARPPISREH
jgi:hypothetical protein